MLISYREAFLGKKPMRDWSNSDSDWILAKNFEDTVWSEEFLRIRPELEPDKELRIPRFFSIERKGQIISEGTSSFAYRPSGDSYNYCRILFSQEKNLYILNFECEKNWAAPLEEKLKKWITEKPAEEIEKLLAKGRQYEDIKTMGLE